MKNSATRYISDDLYNVLIYYLIFDTKQAILTVLKLTVQITNKSL